MSEEQEQPQNATVITMTITASGAVGQGDSPWPVEENEARIAAESTPSEGERR